MSPTLQDLILRLGAALASIPGLELAVLFGSVAEGKEHAASDVDVAISGAACDVDVAEVVARMVAREVDVVHLETADVILKNRIARTGTPLFELRRGEFARFAADAALEYMDMEPLLEDGRRRYLRAVARGQS